MMDRFIITVRPKGFKMNIHDKAYHNFYNACSDLRVAYRKNKSEKTCSKIEKRIEKWQDILEFYGWSIYCKHDNGTKVKGKTVTVYDASGKKHILNIQRRIGKSKYHKSIHSANNCK